MTVLLPSCSGVDWARGRPSMTPQTIWASANDISTFCFSKLSAAVLPVRTARRTAKKPSPKRKDRRRNRSKIRSPSRDSNRSNNATPGRGFSKFQANRPDTDHVSVSGGNLNWSINGIAGTQDRSPISNNLRSTAEAVRYDPSPTAFFDVGATERSDL